MGETWVFCGRKGRMQNSRKNPNDFSSDEWIDKMRHIRKMENYLAKKKETGMKYC